MPSNDLKTILKRLLNAYPDKTLSKPTLQVYLEELSDIPVPLLEHAAIRLIQTSAWFPRISELRQVSLQLAGTLDIMSVFPPGVDDLGLQAMQLDNAFFNEGEYDPQKWELLALKMERVGRDYRAEELRRRSAHIQSMLAEDLASSSSPADTPTPGDAPAPEPGDGPVAETPTE